MEDDNDGGGGNEEWKKSNYDNGNVYCCSSPPSSTIMNQLPIWQEKKGSHASSRNGPYNSCWQGLGWLLGSGNSPHDGLFTAPTDSAL